MSRLWVSGVSRSFGVRGLGFGNLGRVARFWGFRFRRALGLQVCREVRVFFRDPKLPIQHVFTESQQERTGPGVGSASFPVGAGGGEGVRGTREDGSLRRPRKGEP